MADVTVAQFADVLKVPVDRLLVQLEQAGIPVAGAEEKISDEAKMELLTHLRRSHGNGESQTARREPKQDHAQAQAAERAEAGQRAGQAQHRQRRSAQQAHLRQARRGLPEEQALEAGTQERR